MKDSVLLKQVKFNKENREEDEHKYLYWFGSKDPTSNCQIYYM